VSDQQDRHERSEPKDRIHRRPHGSPSITTVPDSAIALRSCVIPTGGRVVHGPSIWNGACNLPDPEVPP
jgi:hypothetical protein